MAAFNVINPEAIDALLKRDDAVLGALLASVLRRPLLRQERGFVRVVDYPPDPPAWLTPEKFAAHPVYRFVGDASLDRDIECVARWLATARERKAAWLARQLPDGRVKRLSNLGELHSVLALARKDLQRWGMRPPGAAELRPSSEHVEWFVDASHGRSWMQLRTAVALALEGEWMSHCVGGNSYRQLLEAGLAGFYSLRSMRGKALVTAMTRIDADGEEVVAVARCFKNASTARYAADLAVLAEELRRRCLQLIDERLPPMLPRLGRHHQRHCTAEEAVHAGDFILVGAPDHVPLARTLHVRGNMTIARCRAQIAMPDALRIDGDLRILDAAALHALPRWLRVGGDLVLRGCGSVEALPAECQVGRDLLLVDCPGLRLLPRAMRVGRYLLVQRCPGLVRAPLDLAVELIVADGVVFTSSRDWATMLQARRRSRGP